MLYNCGSIEGYDYIYNSDDNSCKLVERDSYYGEKRTIGVVDLPDKGSLNLSKLKMVYGFKDISYGAVLNLCEYEIYFTHVGYTKFRLSIRVLVLDNISAMSVLDWSRNKDFNFNGYTLLLMIEQFKCTLSLPRVKTVPPLCVDMIESEKFYSYLQFPLVMLDCIVRHAKAQGFMRIDEMFNGALYTNTFIPQSEAGAFGKVEKKPLE